MENLFKEIGYHLNGIKWMAAVQRYWDILTTPGWWQLLLCFLACSLLMIIRLNAIEKKGFQGTLIGTLIMPYISGFPNLCFAWFMAKKNHGSSLVIENSLVNNLTNLTLILGLSALIFGLNLKPKTNHDRTLGKINHLSLTLSILAMIFFGLSVWALGRDGLLNTSDGLLLVGIFLFWQLYHVFDVLKNNTRTSRKIQKRLIFDFLIISVCAWGVFSSTDYLIQWVEAYDKGFFSKSNLGFISGVLMVIPNAFLAFWYAAVKRPEIAYSSQIGDCHICIPLCIGIFAVFNEIRMDPVFIKGLFILIGGCGVHLFFTVFFSRLARPAGLLLIGLYVYFVMTAVI